MLNRIKLTLFFAALLTVLPAWAEPDIDWSAKVEMKSATKGDILVSAKLTKGYHFYAFAPDGGYNSLEMAVEPQDGIKAGSPAASVAPTKHYDEDFGMDISSWYSDVNFTIPFEITDKASHKLDVKLRWQSCTEEMCLAPTKKTLTVNAEYGKAGLPADNAAATPAAEAPAEDEAAPAEDEATEETPAEEATAETLADASDLEARWWEPVEAEAPTSGQTPWNILIIGFLGGLAAMLTPCVWPLIPMTVSFFLKKAQKKQKDKSIKKFIFNRDAMLYGVSIIVIYVLLGLAITLIFGAGKLNELSTSAWFNIFLFVVLVVFAVSFLGAFDIKLPESWSNAMDSKAETTSGIISIFFMAFTLALVSFSCTGPIIGTLLVEAASQGSILGPALGMGGFALGLALPFTFFALFPTLLKSMPKSGGWLNSVKVVLGFIELILSLKFLSVADMAYGWRILDREVFISLWVVLFVLLGLYLLGKLTFSHDDKIEKIGVARFILAVIPLSFAVYLVPGLWGAPLKAASAFVPPLTTQDFNLYSPQHSYAEFDDYNEGMAYALEHNMPVLVDFSGYGCVNCRKMETAVVDTPEVFDLLLDNFVVIKLMVDDKASLPHPYKVEDNGKTIDIASVGDKWTYLQSHKFGASAQPYYIVLDNQGQPMSSPMSYSTDLTPADFVLWLDKALSLYRR